MQYDAKTPAEYIDLLENDWRREALLAVRDYIMKYGPDLEEGIQYKMLHYGLNDQTVFNLNAQRNYVSLYIGNIDKIPGGKALFKAFDLGKGCIRIKKSTDIAETGLESFIQKVIGHWKSGGDISC